MRYFALFFIGMVFALGLVIGVSASAQPPAAPITAPAATRVIPNRPVNAQPGPSDTPPWAAQATGEAAATQAAAAFTAVAESTRVEDARRATATSNRQSTLEAIEATRAAATLSALQITAAFEQAAATRAYTLTVAADALAAQARADSATAAAAFTAAAATSTQAYNVLVATETAKRQTSQTTMQNATDGLAPLGQVCWGLLIPLAAAYGLWYLMQLARLDIERRRASNALIDTVWGPAQATFDADGSVTFKLLNPPAEAKAAIAQARQQTTLGVGRQPAVLAARPDDPAEDDLTRVCNLLANAMRVEGNSGTKIPRYHTIGYHAETRERLVNLLVAAGWVVVKPNAGSNSGSFLRGDLTLYQLWADLRSGKATLEPLPHSPTVIQTHSDVR